MAHALQPFVRLSWGLPPHLRDSRGLPAPRAKLPPLDPASPQSYLPHALWLREHAVLRTHCSARSMVWSTLVGGCQGGSVALPGTNAGLPCQSVFLIHVGHRGWLGWLPA